MRVRTSSRRRQLRESIAVAIVHLARRSTGNGLCGDGRMLRRRYVAERRRIARARVRACKRVREEGRTHQSDTASISSCGEWSVDRMGWWSAARGGVGVGVGVGGGRWIVHWGTTGRRKHARPHHQTRAGDVHSPPSNHTADSAAACGSALLRWRVRRPRTCPRRHSLHTLSSQQHLCPALPCPGLSLGDGLLAASQPGPDKHAPAG